MVKINVSNVVGYARVSSESQTDNTSIDLQIEKIKLHCKLHDLKLDKIFIDEAKSGSNTDRQAYNEMMEYIKANDINAMIVYKADRTHRKLKNLLIMIDELEEMGIAYISITESFDTSTSQGMLFLQMIGSFAEFERKIINERTQSGRISKGKKESYAGGRVPFGYKLIDSDRLEIDENESQIVKVIFEMRKEGKALNKIVKHLNDNNVTINNKPFSNSKIEYILSNEVYTGVYRYDGNKEHNDISFKVPKIISKQLYNIVNKQEG